MCALLKACCCKSLNSVERGWIALPSRCCRPTPKSYGAQSVLASDFRNSMAFAIHEYITYHDFNLSLVSKIYTRYIPRLELSQGDFQSGPTFHRGNPQSQLTSHTSLCFDRITHPIDFEVLFKETFQSGVW